MCLFPGLEVSHSVTRSMAILSNGSVWSLCHLKSVGLDFGFFSAAECAVGDVLPDVFIHTLPVILVLYKTVGVSVSLVA